MAIPNFLRKMFGSNVEDNDVDFEDIDRPVVSTTAQTIEATNNLQVPETELPTELLDAILAVINSQLPPIAAECIDREAQRRYLAGQLGSSLIEYAEATRRKAISDLTGDRAKMQAEFEELRAERKEISSKREEQKATLLSEQRQRRALSDRNRDLEAKIDQLDSEIEQHKLTISSLMNKMRVAEVSEGDSVAMREDLEHLRNQLQERDKKLAEQEQEITNLAEKIANYESGSAVDIALQQRHESTDSEDSNEVKHPKKKRGRPRRQVSDYDPENDTSADLESVDWLLPGGVPAGHTPHVADPDFGYQPPKQAPEPDPDAQLTLF